MNCFILNIFLIFCCVTIVHQIATLNVEYNYYIQIFYLILEILSMKRPRWKKMVNLTENLQNIVNETVFDGF